MRIVLGFVEGWLCRGGCRGGGGGVVAMVAVLGGGERDVVEVGAVGSSAVVYMADIKQDFLRVLLSAGVRSRSRRCGW